MHSTDKKSVRILMERCVQHGIQHLVCSPGSRNAPIIIAADLHPSIQTYVIHDERSAAFFALGMSLALNQAVAISCTSGSALLNYYPAVAEAYYQNVPLVVLSADRPEEWVNQGDGQTIVQKNVYANHIRAELSIEENDDERDLIAGIDRVFDVISDWKGPVHFNIPLSEPLYGIDDLDVSLTPINTPVKVEAQLKWDSLLSTWNKSAKKLILCGQMNDLKRLQFVLSELANDSSVLVMIENLSNLQDQKFVHCIDRTLNVVPQDKIEEYQPDLLITVGTNIVSKRIKTFLRSTPNLKHWKLGFEFPEMDTYRGTKTSFEISAEDFLGELLSKERVENVSNFGGKWRSLNYMVKDTQVTVLDEMPFSDLWVFDQIFQFLPEDCHVHLGNSSVVRYSQLFDPLKGHKYYCNRGTSGIDGSLSTAVGFASSIPEKTHYLIIGDVSFFYDSNGLWNKYLPKNLNIILINNSGGGIFRYIDGASTSAQLEKYFEARHETSAEYLCKAYSVGYAKANDIESTLDKLGALVKNAGLRTQLLEIHTPPELNDKILRKYFTESKLLINAI